MLWSNMRTKILRKYISLLNSTSKIGVQVLLLFGFLYLGSSLAGQPIYLDKYTLNKIYLEGAEELNRYYILAYLFFEEGKSYTSAELERLLEDSRRAMRSQWYFQADFDVLYYPDGRVEVYVLLEPSAPLFGFMGAAVDGHSFYFGLRGRLPGSAVRWQLGKVSGFSWYLPRIANTLFGLNLIFEIQTQNFLENLDINNIANTVFWLRGGIEEFVELSIPIRLGFAQEYWSIWKPGKGKIADHDIVVAVIFDADGLYLLQSRLWAMRGYIRFDVGLLSSMLLLRMQYQLLLLPLPWLELNFHISGIANALKRLAIGPLEPELPGEGQAAHDFAVLGRLKTVFLLSRNAYDNRRAALNFGFALEGKFGLSGGIFNGLIVPQPGAELQGGLVFDVLTPGAFTTRFYFMVGLNLVNLAPTAEFMVESRF